MNVDMDTDDWLGCPAPLEMYQHQCALLEDELVQTEAMLRKARANIAGLVQMNDLLATGKASAEAALKEALELSPAKSNDAPDNLSFRPIDLITQQRDHLFRENQQLLMELKSIKEPLDEFSSTCIQRPHTTGQQEV
ncbi:hypothetical protein [Pseudomonas sp. GXZC]|uniref:hypothetical protein n=1 Tax=Pseudomonas sp. GXZC TaxID=3003351 RepID=UPI0022AB3EC5|nr:hypothetical protein [Pseudomonas sp. GXZC]WAT26717.1 hypothetical protein OZ428_22395 [Pseudomonas sp. GXZC]